MTKERRLAIEMWERIVEELENGKLNVSPSIMVDDDECGCTHRVNTLWNRVSALGDASAAKYIAKLLKGKYLGTRKEIENDKI